MLHACLGLLLLSFVLAVRARAGRQTGGGDKLAAAAAAAAGCVEVLDELDGEPVDVQGAGSCFGEESLLTMQPRPAHCVAGERATVLVLTKIALLVRGVHVALTHGDANALLPWAL